LVLERTYFKSLNKNSIKLFLVDLKKATDISQKSVCDLKPKTRLLLPRLLFDFEDPIKRGLLDRVDNVEGMTLSHDRKHLILVTDNNFRSSQETQIIVLAINPKATSP